MMAISVALDFSRVQARLHAGSFPAHLMMSPLLLSTLVVEEEAMIMKGSIVGQCPVTGLIPTRIVVEEAVTLTTTSSSGQGPLLLIHRHHQGMTMSVIATLGNPYSALVVVEGEAAPATRLVLVGITLRAGITLQNSSVIEHHVERSSMCAGTATMKTVHKTQTIVLSDHPATWAGVAQKRHPIEGPRRRDVPILIIVL